jgi:hypothetical protein
MVARAGTIHPPGPNGRSFPELDGLGRHMIKFGDKFSTFSGDDMFRLVAALVQSGPAYVDDIRTMLGGYLYALGGTPCGDRLWMSW